MSTGIIMIVYYMMVEDINNLLTKLERELIKLAQGKYHDRSKANRKTQC